MTIAPAWQIFTFTFKNVDSTKKLDLTDVKPLMADGKAFPASSRQGGCAGAIRVQKLSSAGAYTTQYSYYSTLDPAGWYDEQLQPVAKGSVPFEAGEGFAVNNEYISKTSGVAASVLFQVSGEVDLVCKNDIPVAWSINGNSTPVAIDLTSINMLMADGNPFPASSRQGGCAGAIRIQKLSAAGAYTTQYSFYSTLDPAGWYDEQLQPVAKNAVPFAAGEGFAINNEYIDKKSGTGVSVKIQLPSPIK